jgi:hypothetical protein
MRKAAKCWRNRRSCTIQATSKTVGWITRPGFVDSVDPFSAASFCCRGRSRPLGVAFLQCCPLHRRDASPPVAPARAKMGRMSNRSSDRHELRVLGSFRNSAHRQEAVGSFRNSGHRQQAVGSFRNSLASALQSLVYEISEIALEESIAPTSPIRLRLPHRPYFRRRANFMPDQSASTAQIL